MTADHVNHYLVLLRPRHYFKNLFIFSPLFFGLKITDLRLFLDCLTAFILFSLVASAIYIFNDYRDIAEDRIHPTKRNRPLASGAIPVSTALSLMTLLLISGLVPAYFFNQGIFYLIVIYALLNISYSLKLKHIAIIDVFVIAIGFVLRIFVGSMSTHIKLSSWIILMTFLLALFLALAKRRDDVMIFIDTGIKTREVVNGYNMELLNGSMLIMASVVIVSYIMYTLSPEVILKTHSDKLYLTVVFVIMGIIRYMQIEFVENKGEAPTDVFLKDRFLQLSILCWIFSFIVILYL
ncbi:MAG: decaprenyl-phosphate phosphoribosyltransferase [Nitrospirae bacterium]|nr:decaprenyl-phosphate phosphoribosyltransferase [Nitrospirota bacterium]